MMTDSSQPAPQSQEPRPPCFIDILEATLLVPLIPKKIFDKQSVLPEPDIKQIIGNILLWSFSAFGLWVFLQYVQNELSLSSSALYAAALPACLAVALGASSLLALLLQGFALLSGGTGGFRRSLQVVSLLSLIIPLLLLRDISPKFPFIAAVYWSFLAVRGVSSLHRIPFMQAGFVAGASIVILILVGLIGRNFRGHFGLLRPGPAAILETTSPSPQSASGSSLNMPMSRPADSTQLSSSLDMIRSVSLPIEPLQNPSSNNAPPPLSSDQIQQMQAMSAGLLGNLIGLSQNPEFMNSLNAQQKQQMQRLLNTAQNIMSIYQARSQGGRKAAGLSDAEAKMMTQQLQQIMSGLQAIQTSATPSTKRKTGDNP